MIFSAVIFSFSVGFPILKKWGMKGVFLLTLVSSFGLVNAQFVTATDKDLSVKFPQYTMLTIQCGKGSVIIHTDTGKVELTGGCTPDEGAKAFWNAVEKMGFKREPSLGRK
jgi:hypothetical protein